jgi:hypothetical protein
MKPAAPVTKARILVLNLGYARTDHTRPQSYGVYGGRIRGPRPIGPVCVRTQRDSDAFRATASAISFAGFLQVEASFRAVGGSIRGRSPTCAYAKRVLRFMKDSPCVRRKSEALARKAIRICVPPA